MLRGAKPAHEDSRSRQRCQTLLRLPREKDRLTTKFLGHTKSAMDSYRSWHPFTHDWRWTHRSAPWSVAAGIIGSRLAAFETTPPKLIDRTADVPASSIFASPGDRDKPFNAAGDRFRACRRLAARRSVHHPHHTRRGRPASIDDREGLPAADSFAPRLVRLYHCPTQW